MNRVDQDLRARVFEQEPGGAGTECGKDVFVQVERGDHDHLDWVLGVEPGKDASGLQPVHPGHANVHQHDIGLTSGDQRDRFASVLGLADDFEAGLVL